MIFAQFNKRKQFIYMVMEIVFTSFFVNLVQAQVPTPPAGYIWQKIERFTDEFNGTQLDATKWSNLFPYWSGRESKFTASNISVSGGNLRMRSGVNSTTVSVIDSTNSTAVVTAAAVSSKTMTASFGYYEARVKASKLSMTSSFWLQSYRTTPYTIEIDVIELLGAPVISPGYNRTMCSSTHCFLNRQDLGVSKFYTMPTPCGEQFNVYGVWWKDARTIYYYFNGQKVNEIINPPPGNVDFNKSQYMFFTTEVFRWYGYPTVASLKNDSLNTMLVDYVRGWELVPDPVPKPAKIASLPFVTSGIETPYSYKIEVQGNPVPTISVSGLPSWLSYSSDSAIIKGTPRASDIGASQTIRVIVKNNVGADTLDYHILVSMLKNPGFETGNSLWSFTNGTASANASHEGNYSAELAGLSGGGSGSGLSRTVTGLQPNTSYTLSCWASISDTSKSAYLYVKNFGGTEIQKPIKSTDFSQLVITFTTGANSTTADIGVWKPITTANAFCDDFILLPTDKYVPVKPQIRKMSLQNNLTKQPVYIYNVLGKTIPNHLIKKNSFKGIYFVKSPMNGQYLKMVAIGNH